MKQLNEKLVRKMYGYNYCVSLGFETLGVAQTGQALKTLIKQVFPDSKPFDSPLIKTEEREVWLHIKSCFDYRGDSDAGLKLNVKEEKELQSLQGQFCDAIKEKVDKYTVFYQYSSDEGIPGYPVFWDFRFVFNQGDKWYFVYGSASD